MADGRRQEDWSHTAHLLSLVANCHRDPKKRRTPFQPADFDPTRKRRKRKREKKETGDIRLLKTVFVDSRK